MSVNLGWESYLVFLSLNTSVVLYLFMLTRDFEEWGISYIVEEERPSKNCTIENVSRI